MTNTTKFSPAPAPANSAPASFQQAGAPTTGDGWIFFPASRYSTSTGFNPARAAAQAAAAAMRATGHKAWAGRGPAGGWGTFLATA